jgi:hypothetical protein
MSGKNDTKGTGCGIWPFLFRGWPKNACEWHDKAYTEKSWAEHNLTRLEVDRIFLAQLKELSGRNPLKQIASRLMYGVVRALGWKWWEGK